MTGYVIKLAISQGGGTTFLYPPFTLIFLCEIKLLLGEKEINPISGSWLLIPFLSNSYQEGIIKTIVKLYSYLSFPKCVGGGDCPSTVKYTGDDKPDNSAAYYAVQAQLFLYGWLYHVLSAIRVSLDLSLMIRTRPRNGHDNIHPFNPLPTTCILPPGKLGRGDSLKWIQIWNSFWLSSLCLPWLGRQARNHSADIWFLYEMPR